MGLDSLMLQHVVGSAGQGWPASQFLGPIQPSLTNLCAWQLLCCLLSPYQDGAFPQGCLESSGGARGTHGSEAECEQCSAVCSVFSTYVSCGET